MPSAKETLVAAVEAHVPCTHLCWPVGHAGPLPWAAYSDDPDGYGADDANLATKHRWTVELYEKYPDEALEKALFDDLRGIYGFVEPPETTWVEAEKCYCTFYRFQEIERI